MSICFHILCLLLVESPHPLPSAPYPIRVSRAQEAPLVCAQTRRAELLSQRAPGRLRTRRANHAVHGPRVLPLLVFVLLLLLLLIAVVQCCARAAQLFRDYFAESARVRVAGRDRGGHARVDSRDSGAGTKQPTIEKWKGGYICCKNSV